MNIKAIIVLILSIGTLGLNAPMEAKKKNTIPVLDQLNPNACFTFAPLFTESKLADIDVSHLPNGLYDLATTTVCQDLPELLEAPAQVATKSPVTLRNGFELLQRSLQRKQSTCDFCSSCCGAGYSTH